MDSANSAPVTARRIFAGVKAALELQPWRDEMRETWPTPIANEVEQLLRMLGDGADAGGLLMQVRDTAEVLLKSLTLIAAADLIAHGGPDGATAARQALFSNPMALGHWRQALAGFAKVAATGLLAPEIPRLAAAKGDLLTALDAYIEQRNRDVGHGAYRPDSVEIARRISVQLLGEHDQYEGCAGGLDRAFAAVAQSRLWQDCAIRVGAADGPPFVGAGRVLSLRVPPHAGHGQTVRRLYLVRGERALDLYPFITGRVCDECRERDAFLFDSPKGRNPASDQRFDFLDYANGHKLVVNARHAEPDLARLADIPRLDLAFDRSGSEFSSRDVVRLLDDIMFDNRFASPDWLRGPLRRHMEGNAGGIFWLQAPAHVGKTMFVRGLFGEGLSKEQRHQQRALLGDAVTLDVAPLFLKREYRFDAAQFASAMENQVRSALRPDTRLALQLPREGGPEALQAGFARFAREALQAARANRSDRLILAFDGLDELRDPEGAVSAVDYIPSADALPEGVTLLLTSRPPQDCPPWLQSRLGRGFAPAHESHCVGLADEGYLGLLRGYVGRHSGVAPGEADFEEVLGAILRRSESLFLIVSFLCDLIREDAASGLDSPEPAVA